MEVMKYNVAHFCVVVNKKNFLNLDQIYFIHGLQHLNYRVVFEDLFIHFY